MHLMPYLESVVKETLRMYPSLPFIERKCVAKKGYKIDEKLTIPHGMQVIIPTYSLHRDLKVFYFIFNNVIIFISNKNMHCFAVL